MMGTCGCVGIVPCGGFGDILKHLLGKAQTLKIPTRMDMEDTYTAVWYCGMVGWYSNLLFPIPLHYPWVPNLDRKKGNLVLAVEVFKPFQDLKS